MSWEKEYNDPSIGNEGICWPVVWMVVFLFGFFIRLILIKEGIL